MSNTPRAARLLRGIAFGIALIVVSAPGHAVCDVPLTISSGQSYVYTPGVSNGYNGSSITPSFQGSFWILGHGDPLPDAGIDNGTFPALDNGWLVADPDTPARIGTAWNADPRIDGCPYGMGVVCTAALLSDQQHDTGYVAFLTHQSGTAYFGQPGNAPINLARIAPPVIVDSTRTGAYDVAATVRAPSFVDDLYLDDGCEADTVVAYRVHQQAVPLGSAPPSNRERASGWANTGPLLPPDGEHTIQLACDGDSDIYLAVSLVTTDGFETAHVSENSEPIPCGHCPGPDPDGDGWGDCDCDSTNPDIYPGAPEINDGLDNQCAGNAGHGVIDETSGNSGFHDPEDENTYSWPPQSLATSYEIVRSASPGFLGDCGAVVTGGSFWTDTDEPPPATAFFYLNRPLEPFTGSWGQDDRGVERLGMCSCPHEKCETGSALHSGCEPCVHEICQLFPTCCSVAWSGACVEWVRTVCDILVCPESQGDCSHPLCETGDPLLSGCDSEQADCVYTVCLADPDCCSVGWGEACVQAVHDVCGLDCEAPESELFVWSGASDQTTWNDPNNWIRPAGVLPGYPSDADDRALIDATAHSIHTPSIPLTLRSLELGGSFTGTLTIGGGTKGAEQRPHEREPVRDRGPVAYWTFDDATASSAMDLSGKGHVGTLIGMDATNRVRDLPPARQLHNTSALKFDGLEGYVEVGDRPALGGFDALTLSAWIKPTGEPGVGRGRIVHKGHGESTDGYALAYSPAEGGHRIVFLVRTDAGVATLESRTAVPPNTGWHHIAAVWDGERMELFLDGTPDASRTHSGKLVDRGGPLGIGGHVNDKTARFAGLIDEVWIFDREPAPFEIAKLADGTASPALLASALHVVEDLILGSGTLASGGHTVLVSRDWINQGGNFSAEDGTVIMNGTAGTFGITSGASPFASLFLDDGGGSAIFVLEDDLDVDRDLRILNGTLDAHARPQWFNVYVGGYLAVLDTFLTGDNTVVLDGPGTIAYVFSGGTTFNDLQVDGSLVVAVDELHITRDLTVRSWLGTAHPVSVGRNMLLDGGQFLIVEADVVVGGDWTAINSAAFESRDATVVLDGTGFQRVVAGGQPFEDVRITNASGTVLFPDAQRMRNLIADAQASNIEIRFGEGVTHRIDRLVLSGEGPNEVVLDSQLGIDPWFLVYAGPQVVSHVAAARSNASPDAGESANIDATDASNADGAHESGAGTNSAHWKFPGDSGADLGLDHVRLFNEGTDSVEILSGRMSERTDDAEEYSSGEVFVGGVNQALLLDLAYDSASHQTVGLRFPNLDIPQGATLTRAYLQFTALGMYSTGSVDLTIRGQDSADASPFGTATNDLTNRPRTSASVVWSPPEWTILEDDGLAQQTPDLSPLIQEIMDRADWSPGNAVAFFVNGDGSNTNRRVALGVDSSHPLGGSAPRLHVEFTPTENGILVDGARGATFANDEEFTAARGRDIVVGDYREATGIDETNEVIAWRPGRPPTLLENAPWTPGQDVVDVAFAPKILLPVYAWIVRGAAPAGPTDPGGFDLARDYLLEHRLAGESSWHFERMGVAFERLEAIDATLNPNASLYYDVDLTGEAGETATVTAIKRDIGFRPEGLNVYYVDTVGAYDGTFAGWWARCSPTQAGVIFMARIDTVSDTTLVHEIGHAFSLQHPHGLLSTFDPSNVMWAGGTYRWFFSEGQTFRAGYQGTSILNGHLNELDLRPGLPTRDCPAAMGSGCHAGYANLEAIEDDNRCPPVQTRIWADGAKASGTDVPGRREIRVLDGVDDAEENVSTGAVILDSPTLELGEDTGEFAEQLVAIRFQNVAIPRRAAIGYYTYVRFTAAAVSSTPATFIIKGQAAGDAPAFEATSGNLSSRETTTATAYWSGVNPWETVGESGIPQTSPTTLTDVIQEIVDRPDWFSGNALVLIFSGSVPGGNRTAFSFEGDPSGAPLLHVEFNYP